MPWAAEAGKGAAEAGAAKGAADVAATELAGTATAAELGAGAATAAEVGGAATAAEVGAGAATAAEVGGAATGVGAGAGMTSADLAALYGDVGYGAGTATGADAAVGGLTAAENAALTGSTAPDIGAFTGAAPGDSLTSLTGQTGLPAATPSAVPTGASGAVTSAPLPSGGALGADAGLPATGANLPVDASLQGSVQPGAQAIENAAVPGASSAPDGAGGMSLQEGSTPSSAISQPSTVDTALNALKAGVNSKWAPTVAATGLNMYSQQRQANAAQKQYQAIAAKSKATSDALLSKFNSGQLTTADQQGIAQWATNQKAAVKQYYEKAGLGNSSMAVQAISQIDQQADQMRQSALTSELDSGLKAAGVSDPTLAAGIKAGLTQDQQAQTAMTNLLAALAKMNTTTQTPTTGTPGG